MGEQLGLQDRLGALARAVPVQPPSPASAIVRRPVGLGPALRPAPGRAWLPIALVAALVVAAVGIIASGARPASGPVVETTRLGDFELTLTSAKGRYAPDEPIEIEATLTYRGPEEGVEIRHAQGAGSRSGVTGSPLGFGIREPVIGDLRLGPIWQESCEQTGLVRDVPLTQPFEKSAGWSGSDPRSEEYQAWTVDPVLRLGPGTWHVYAVAEFSIGECSPDPYVLEAEIAITVEPTTPSTTAEPSPTDAPNPEQSATVRAGDFELTLSSNKTRYTPGERIEVLATLTYVGQELSVEILTWPGFGIREPIDGDLRLVPPAFVANCSGGTAIARAVPREYPFAKTASSPEYWEHAFMKEPELRLSPGEWHIYADFDVFAGFSRLCAPLAQLRAELTIVVDGEPTAQPPTSSPSSESSMVPNRSEARDGPWRLTLSSPRSQYRASEPIDVTVGLGYWGDQPSIETYGSSSGRYWSVIREVDGVRGMGAGMFADCRPQGSLVAGQPLEVPWAKGVGYAPDDPNLDFYRDWIDDPVLWLPAGTWEFQVTTSFMLAPECADPAPELTARIVITVTE